MILDREHNALFTILGNYLFSNSDVSIDILEGIQWADIIGTAKKQTVLGLLADSVGLLPTAMQPPKEIVSKLRKHAYQTLMSHMLLDRVLSEAACVLRQAAIPFVVLKGQAIALEYPNPQMRQCGDIDLYVGSDRYQDAIQAFHEAWEFPDAHNEVISKHYTVTHDNVKIEIHRMACQMNVPWRNRVLQRWMAPRLSSDAMLDVHRWGLEDVKVPKPDFNAFYIFYHAWHHILTVGVGLRQLYDWAMVLYNHADEIDTPQLQKLLERLCLLKEWQTMGYILVNCLGLPSEKFPLYTRAMPKNTAKVLNIILKNGNFGIYDSGRKRYTSSSFMAKKSTTLFNISRTLLRTYSLKPMEMTFGYLSRFAMGLGRVISNKN